MFFGVIALKTGIGYLKKRMRQRLEIKRMLGRLRDLVEDSEVPRHSVDECLGHAPGYLSQLLAGTIDLKYRHLVTILDAIDCPPERFFETVYPLPHRRRRGPASPELATMLQLERDGVGVYGLGIEAVDEMRGRLARCEEVLRAILANPQSSKPR